MQAVVDGIAKTSLLIADGHHRYETALRYAGEVSEAHPKAPARAEHRFVLTFLVNGDDPDLVVFPTHRFVHSLASFLLRRAFLPVKRARTPFEVRRRATALAPTADMDRLGELALAGSERGPELCAAAAGDGRIALLTLRGDLDLSGHPTLGKVPAVLRKTDVAVLHAALLEHILGITPQAQAAKTNLAYPQDAHAALADLRSGKGKRALSS